MLYRPVLLLLAAFCFLVPLVSSAYACPSVHGLQDINCDGKFRMAVLGDSIGRGSRGNLRAAGSFAKRIKKYYRFISVKNLSLPGLSTSRAISYLRRNFPKNDYEVTKSLLIGADFVLIELGVNDFFSNPDPNVTIENLKTLVQQVRRYGAAHGGTPYVATSLITPIRQISEARIAQAHFVSSLNESLLDQQSDELPAYVRFDKVPVTDILDAVHPNTSGHDIMTTILKAFIKKTFKEVAETPTPTPTATETPTPTPTP